jgi:hypothetical protein
LHTAARERTANFSSRCLQPTPVPQSTEFGKLTLRDAPAEPVALDPHDPYLL